MEPKTLVITYIVILIVIFIIGALLHWSLSWVSILIFILTIVVIIFWYTDVRTNNPEAYNQWGTIFSVTTIIIAVLFFILAFLPQANTLIPARRRL